MTRCTVDNTYTMLRIKTSPRRGGVVENVYMDHCKGGKMLRVFNIFTYRCGRAVLSLRPRAAEKETRHLHTDSSQ